MRTHSDIDSDCLSYHELDTHIHILHTTNEIVTNPAKNMYWHDVHDSLIIDKPRHLFDSDLGLQSWVE